MRVNTKFRDKRNTVMLPSNFQRTDHLLANESGYIRYDMQRDGDSDDATPSSADYKIKRVIGEKHIA